MPFSQNNPQDPPYPQDPYNSFYYSGGGYTPFAAGDMRDSIAAIWSRASPSGADGVAAFSSGYGQFPDTSTGQFAANSTPTGQFAANLTGHFPATSDLSMFGAGGDYSAAYGQPQYNYNSQYTQWGDTTTSASASTSGVGGGRNASYNYMNAAGHPGSDDTRGVGGHRERAADIQHGLEGMRLGGMKKGESNGYQHSSQPKKMSWANVASQPAKPQASQTKTKKPGVLPPPAMIPSVNKPSIPGASSPVGLPDGRPVNEPSPKADHNPAPDLPPMGGMNHGSTPSAHQPPPMQHQPPQSSQSDSRNAGNASHHREDGGGNHPPRNNMSNQGPRVHKVTANGNSSSGNMSSNRPHMDLGHGSKTHPVLENLKSSNEYNPKNFDLSPKNARFFVIKSFSEDDIHRSIKYEIWCSTEHGNKRLDTAFKERSGKGPIFLLFSVNGSGHFCGMAQMLSGVDYNTASNVWVQDKFKGQFKVKWIYVKDVPNGHLRHIRLENNENKPVTNSRDTQEVPPEKGVQVLKILHGYKHQTSIFDDFFHYEKRQEEEGKKNVIPGMNNSAMDNRHHHDSSGGHPRGDRESRRGGKGRQYDK